MGLLDFNNPELIQGLMMLTAKKGQTPGLLQNFLQMQEMRKQRALQEQIQKQQMEARQMQMDQQREQQAQQQQIRTLGAKAFAPNQNLVQGDDEGNAMPSSGGGGMPEFARGLMGIDPMLGAQFMPKQQGPVRVGASDRLIDPATGKVVVDAMPDKPKTPMIGQTREIKSGGKVLTYEWDGSKWAKIADAPQFKPDAPEKPEKAPQGYRWAGDKLEAIPGGPADTKAGEKAEALQKREQGALARADFVISKIGEAKAAAKGLTTTGFVGGVSRNVPGSPAYKLNRLLDPIKANIGFAELQAMREASPTGGALGQVAVQELNMLQSVLGSLDNAQSEEQLIGALTSIEKHFNNWKRVVQQAKGGGGGASGSWSIRPLD